MRIHVQGFVYHISMRGRNRHLIKSHVQVQTLPYSGSSAYQSNSFWVLNAKIICSSHPKISPISKGLHRKLRHQAWSLNRSPTPAIVQQQQKKNHLAFEHMLNATVGWLFQNGFLRIHKLVSVGFTWLSTDGTTAPRRRRSLVCLYAETSVHAMQISWKNSVLKAEIRRWGHSIGRGSTVTKIFTKLNFSL